MRNSKKRIILFLFASGLILSLCAGDYIRNHGGINYIRDIWNYCFINYKEKLHHIEGEYEMEIHYKIDENFIPPLWKLPPINGKATPISDFELTRYANILDDILKNIPKIFSKRTSGDCISAKHCYFTESPTEEQI